MVDRLAGSRTIADLKTRVLPAGLRDVQDWTDVTLTFRRRDPNTGWTDVVTVPAISMPASNGQPLEAVGGVETTVRKTLKVWAADVADTPLKQGDRFTHDGHVCVVDVVHPTRLDLYVVVEYTLLEGN